MRTFTVNGKRYNAVPFSFNTVCDLEEQGVSIAQMSEKPMSMVRAYFNLCFKGSKTEAGEEIEAHVKKGGKFDEIYTVMGDEMNESDFFLALKENEGEETPESKATESQEKKE